MSALRFSQLFYLQFPSGNPTQGDVFSGLQRSTHSPDTGLGVIITPRCDLANDKARIVNYLPVVSLNEFFATEASYDLLDRAKGELLDSLKKQIKKTPAALGLLAIGVPPDDVESQMAGLGQQEACSPGDLKHLKEAAEKWRRIREHEKRESLPLSLLDGIVSAQDIRRKKTSLIKNNQSTVHFFPPSPPHIPEPSLALLRNVMTIDIDVIRGTGLAEERATPERLLRVRSPFIESLMARLGALFGRVGVPDILDADMASILGDA